jgi:hypothetical protein
VVALYKEKNQGRQEKKEEKNLVEPRRRRKVTIVGRFKEKRKQRKGGKFKFFKMGGRLG